MYNILESRIEFKNNELDRITVLVEMSKDNVRVIAMDTIGKPGYKVLEPNEPLNETLLQKVAGYGWTRVGVDSLFRGWKLRYDKMNA